MTIHNKRQHWLPVGYLKQFSAAEHKERTSHVWMLRKSGRQQSVSCESQGFGKYFYSAERPDLEQRYFKAIEAELPAVTRIVETGQSPCLTQMQTLIEAMIVMQVRNPSLENRSGRERLAGLDQLRRIFYGQIIARLPSEAPVEEIVSAVGVALRDRWTMVAYATDEPMFITSDNPAFIVKHQNGGHALMLPLSPKAWVAIHDERITIRKPRLESDVHALNEAQAFNAHGALYSHAPIPEERKTKYLSLFGRAFTAPMHYDDGGATLRLISAGPFAVIEGTAAPP